LTLYITITEKKKKKKKEDMFDYIAYLTLKIFFALTRNQSSPNFKFTPKPWTNDWWLTGESGRRLPHFIWAYPTIWFGIGGMSEKAAGKRRPSVMGRRLREKCTCERENDNIISYDWTNLSEGVIIITTDGGRRKITTPRHHATTSDGKTTETHKT